MATFFFSHAGLKEDFDRAIQRVNTLEAENAELRSKHRSITIQNLQKEKDVVEARKSLHELEETLKSLTVDNATLKKNIENRKNYWWNTKKLLKSAK